MAIFVGFQKKLTKHHKEEAFCNIIMHYFLKIVHSNYNKQVNYIQMHTSIVKNDDLLTPERPMGHICPMFFSCICYMNITKKKTILNSRQFYFR